MLKENGEQLLKSFADTAYPEAVTKVTSGIYHEKINYYQPTGQGLPYWNN
jgi:hypothetical protein